MTAAVVGDGILVISSIKQRPHNGISLFINGIASTDPSADLSCSTKNRVLGHQVIYYCIAKRSGTVTLRTNTEFCETVLNSQQINITIEEQRIMPNETHGMYVASVCVMLKLNATNSYMRMNICPCVCMCVCVRVCVCACEYMPVCMSVCVCMCV